MVDRHRRSNFHFTAESVTEGHPDKLADRIADAILDAILQDDPEARVAVEVLVATGLVLVAGQITTKTYVDIPTVSREAIRTVGYTRAKFGFDADNVAVLVTIDPQSEDIKIGVDAAQEYRHVPETELRFPEEKLGAGDQGVMFGYGCRETETDMRLPITLAHRLAKRLAHVRKQKILPWLRPDGKTQVTVRYENGKPVEVTKVLISAQHAPDVSNVEIRDGIIEEVIKKIIPPELLSRETEFLVNPTGRFIKGGPSADTGLSGRKIIVDTYGGYCRHGGGSFSGKDPTKVDRSANYYARYIAKNLVAAGYVDEVEVQLSYAIGRARPLSFELETFGTHKVDPQKLLALVQEHFQATPGAMIRELNLRQVRYTPLSAYGHFGREDLDLPWEQLDRTQELLDDLPL